MSYLNPPYENNFKELCAAMPLYYLDVKEMRAVLRAQGYLLDGVCDGMEKLVNVNFILTADEATIRQWEKGLKITYKNHLTLDQRKRVVIGYIIGLGHIGEREIRRIIGQYNQNHVDFDFMRGVISILVEGEIFDEENLLKTLLRRIPAHLGLNISIHIRKQYRQTISIKHGGAVGSYFLFEPVVQEHISAAQQLPLWQGARDYTNLTSQPPTPQETIRTNLDFSQGGMARPFLDAGDTPDLKESVKTRIPLLHGGTSTAEHMIADTPVIRETAEIPVSFAQGTLNRPRTTGNPSPIKKPVVGAQKGAGGLYCHTHVKSKLIE